MFGPHFFSRRNELPYILPPLRERGEDIRELAEHFLRLYTPQGRTLRLTSEFIERLEAHSWPGNVRELANCLRRAGALATGTEIVTEGLEGPAWEHDENEKEEDKTPHTQKQHAPTNLAHCLRPRLSPRHTQRR